MNLSNNISTSSSLYSSLVTIDQISRYYCLSINLVFIGVLITSREIRTKNLFYVNHATVVNTFYPALLFAYIFGNTPNFADENINTILCTISGYFREFANYIRSYSILLIAAYRYLGVFHVDIYRRVNKSTLLLLSPLGLVWFLCIIIPIIIEKSLKTHLTINLCLNGDSDSLSISIAYFIISYFMQTVLPLTLVIYAYVKIMGKLKRAKKVLKLGRLINSRKENRFALHFFLMCLIVVLTSFVFLVFYLNHIIPDYFVSLFYWLPVLRVLVAIGISLVPITSLYFHPKRARLVRIIRSKINVF